jgi:hypothetical protein
MVGFQSTDAFSPPFFAALSCKEDAIKEISLQLPHKVPKQLLKKTGDRIVQTSYARNQSLIPKNFTR